MRFRRLASISYGVALWAQVSSGALVAILGGAAKADVTSIRQHVPVQLITDAIDFLKSNAWWQLPLVAALSGALGLVRKHLGSPWLWDAVHFHLDEIRKLAFKIEPHDAHHHHRVTLFKHVRWLWCRSRWPWGGWLVAVERSGHATRAGISYFRAPDNADAAEGIAGHAWAAGNVIRVTNLPEVDDRATREDVTRYATQTRMSADAVGSLRQKSRAYCGIPVEVNGKLWGVLVLDSRSPDGIKSIDEVIFPHESRLLGKLLERL